MICLKAVYAVVIVGVFGEPIGYQYATFNGPVSGSPEEVAIPGPQLRGRATKSFDFVAKPDYAFSYGVEDPETGNAQKREESRDGDVVTGEYSLVEPDGSLRTVYYRADSKNGFQATVQRTPAPASTPSPYPIRYELPNQYSVVEPDAEGGPPINDAPDYQDVESQYENREAYNAGASYQPAQYDDYGPEAVDSPNTSTTQYSDDYASENAEQPDGLDY